MKVRIGLNLVNRQQHSLETATRQSTPLTDGYLLIFRDTTHETPTKGDWVAQVPSTYEDIVQGRERPFRVRLMDNKNRWDCAYPPVEILPNDTIVTTTYEDIGPQAEMPYIVSVRLKPSLN